MSKRVGMFSGFSPPLQVVGFIGTRAGDPERGPMVRMRPEDALVRLLTAGELVRVISERRQELAVLEVDESIPKGGCVLRDVAGAAPADVIRVVRLDLEGPRYA
jgi:anaerobic selenocysteine-containing dehydrogenase